MKHSSARMNILIKYFKPLFYYVKIYEKNVTTNNNPAERNNVPAEVIFYR